MNHAPAWKQLYEAAFLEFNPELLPQKVDHAQKAIAERALTLLRENDENNANKIEKEALAKAHLALDALKRINRNRRRVG